MKIARFVLKIVALSLAAAAAAKALEIPGTAVEHGLRQGQAAAARLLL